MQLAIFDIDGTLTDTKAADYDCFLRAFEVSLGIQEINTDWKSYRYSTDSGIVSEILQKHKEGGSPEDVKTIRTQFIKLLKERFETDPIRPIPGAPRLLQELRYEPSWSYAIATGGWRDSAVLKLRTAGLNINGAPIASSDEAYSRQTILKNAIAKAQSTYKNQFERIVYVGDAPWDVRVAAKMQLPFIGISSGSQRIRLESEGVPQILKDYCNYSETLAALETATIPKI